MQMKKKWYCGSLWENEAQNERPMGDIAHLTTVFVAFYYERGWVDKACKIPM